MPEHLTKEGGGGDGGMAALCLQRNKLDASLALLNILPFSLPFSLPASPFLYPQDEGRIAAFQLIELRVLSNWGHPEYTCIYRFRVHGEPVP